MNLSEMYQEMGIDQDVYAYGQKITEDLKERFAEHTFEEITSPAFFERVYERDVKLFIRTGDVRPCGNIMLTSASAVPRVFDKYNVEFDNVIG